MYDPEIESKLQSFTENEAYAIDYNKRLYTWQTYFAGQTPVSAKPERIVLKAVIDGHIIGYIAGHLTNRYDKDAEIQSFYVVKQHQRKGMGTELLKQFLNWTINHQSESLCVGIFPENPYKAFYLKHGGSYINPHWIGWDDLQLLKGKL